MRVKRANIHGDVSRWPRCKFGESTWRPGGRDARNVTIFGGTVHREAVNVELERLGFRSEPELARNLPETQKVLITTHGISDI